MSFNNRYNRSHDFFTSGGGENVELITRHNYEAYFLLYVDNELSKAKRRAVELFVQENPDLEEELVMLQQSVVKPDPAVLFEDKQLLWKGAASTGLINETNYEAYFVLYADGELSSQEQLAVQQFISLHPQYEAAFNLLQQVKLEADTNIVYPDKQELYRKEEEKPVVIRMQWRKIAVAAILLLFTGSIGWYLGRNKEAGTGSMQPVAVNTKPADSRNDTSPASVTTTPAKQQQTAAATGNEVAGARSNDVKNATTGIHTQQQVNRSYTATVKDDSEKAMIALKEQRKNILKGSNPAATSSVIPTEAIATINVKKQTGIAPDKIEPVTATLLPAEKKVQQPIVVTEVSSTAPVEAVYAANTEEEGIFVTSVKKNKMRGLFRKVSRVFDKATNIEPGENSKGGIRIASFEIALK